MLFYLWNCAVVDLFSIIKVISVLKDSIFFIFSNYSSKENISISLSYYRKCFSSTFSHFGWGNSAITSKLSLITFCLFFFFEKTVISLQVQVGLREYLSLFVINPSLDTLLSSVIACLISISACSSRIATFFAKLFYLLSSLHLLAHFTLDFFCIWTSFEVVLACIYPELVVFRINSSFLHAVFSKFEQMQGLLLYYFAMQK